MLSKLQEREYMEESRKGNWAYMNVIFCKSHDREKINLGLDYVQYAGCVMFVNDHDVEIGWKQFSSAIHNAAEERGIKVTIVSCAGNSWIHENKLFVFCDRYSVR